MPLGPKNNLQGQTYITLSFLEYGHVAYQVKGNGIYNNMLANSMPLHIPLTPGVGQKVVFFFFSESCHVAYYISGKNREHNESKYPTLLHAYDPWMGTKGSNIFF